MHQIRQSHAWLIKFRTINKNLSPDHRLPRILPCSNFQMQLSMRNHNDIRWCPACAVKRIQLLLPVFLNDRQIHQIPKILSLIYMIVYILMNTKIKQQSNSSNPKFIINEFSKNQQPSKQIAMKIIGQIEQGLLTIPEREKPFINQKKVFSEADLEGRRMKMIEQIKKNKEKTLRQLNLLEQQEQQVKKALKEVSKTGKETKKQRSQFSPEEKNRIKQILKLASEEQKKKKQKHNFILQTFTNILKKQREEEEQLVEKLRYEHKKAVEHNLINIQLRRKRRDQSQKKLNHRFLQVKKKRYMYMEKQKTDESRRSLEKEIMQSRLEELRKKFKLDFQQIKQHQKFYEKIREEKSIERMQRQKTQNSRSNSTSQRYSKNMFNRILEDEQKEKRKILFQKENQAKQMRIKVSQFQTYIKQNYRPKKKSVQQISHSTQSQRKSRNQLSFEERMAKGNQYLKLARQLRKQKDDPTIEQKPHLIKYVDYLKTLKKNSKKFGNAEKFRSLIKTEQSLDYSSAAQAASLVHHIQNTSKKVSDQKLFETIQNKIDLLKVLI